MNFLKKISINSENFMNKKFIILKVIINLLEKKKEIIIFFIKNSIFRLKF